MAVLPGRSGTSRRRVRVWIAAVVAVVALAASVHFFREAAHAEARQQRVLNFLQGVLVVTSRSATPVELSLSDFPGKPTAVCTVYAYDGLEDLRTFLGPKLHRKYAESYVMDDRKSGLVLVYGDELVATDSRALEPPNYFRTANTRCSRGSDTALVIKGRQIELPR